MFLVYFLMTDNSFFQCQDEENGEQENEVEADEDDVGEDDEEDGEGRSSCSNHVKPQTNEKDASLSLSLSRYL